MNAKDQATLDAAIAALKEGFATALKDALSEHVAVLTELQQRSSNFAARVNASNKIMRGEITSLREQVEALTPKKPVPPVPRISAAAWDDAMSALKLAHPGKTFFAPGIVRATAEARAYQPKAVTTAEQLGEDADEEVTL